MSKVIVIGAGAAGLMAGVTAACKGHRVTIIEHNEKAGKKIYITGKGRCNITNNCDIDSFLKSVVTNPKFLYHSLHEFSPSDLMAFMEENGCPLVTERGNRVFPASGRASDVTATLVRILGDNGGKILFNTKVCDVRPSSMDMTVLQGEVKKSLSADAFIIASGGLAYPATGSTGDGYEIAKALGHSIAACRPTLVPFETNEDWCRKLQGLSLKNVRLTLLNGKRKLYSEVGEMLFTHFGISGPLVLSASSYLKGEGDFVLELDLKPGLSMEQLNARVRRDFASAAPKEIKTVLNGLYPSRLVNTMLNLSGVDGTKRCFHADERDIKAICEVTKKITITIKKVCDFNQAIMTGGGVSVKEINPSTMESKLIPGVYFAGEIIDVDALTGGFNLQIAWSTGHLAGDSIP